MTEPDFPRGWTIRASTSRFFPVQSVIELKPKGRDLAELELEVTWEKQEHAKLKLANLEQGPSGIFKGTFGHPRGAEGAQEKFQLVVTLTDFADGKRRLIGALLQLPDREPGSTGVWVAEEQGPEPQEE